MLVNHSHILEVRELKDHKVILCYIQIAKRSIQYFHGQASPHETHRWMQAEDWTKFDEIFEMMFDNQGAKNRFDEIRENIFHLNASIRVRVRKCRIPVDALQRCILNAATKTGDEVLAFEFFIEFKEWELLRECVSGLEEAKMHDKEIEVYHHEYEPQFITSQKDGAHVPYTPSPKSKPKSNSSKDEDILEKADDDVYTPKPISSDCSQNNNESSPKIPTYKPSRRVLETRSKCMATQDNNKTYRDKKHFKDGEKETYQSKEKERYKQRKLNFDEKYTCDNKYLSKHKDNDQRRDERKKGCKEDEKQYMDVTSNRNHNDDRLNKIKMQSMHKDNEFTTNIEATTSVSAHQEKRKRNISKNSDDVSSIQPRRSSRSPVKPKRLIEETQKKIENDSKRSSSRSPKRSKTNSRKETEDLFGAVDDDDKDVDSEFSLNAKLTKTKSSHLKTPKEIILKAESAYKKRSNSSPQNCAGEMKRMDTWLSKKATTKDTVATKRFKSSKHKDAKLSVSSSVSLSKRKLCQDSAPFIKKSSSDSLPVDYLSKEVIEENILKEKLQLEKNCKIKEMLQEMAGPTPEKVEILNIKDLSIQNILDSFDKYKPELDEIFRRSIKKTQHIKGNGGINNYMVMSLIDKNTPLEMMNKLQDAYEPDCEGIPMYTTIFANAMMPEWIIMLFMDRHKLSRENAVRHVKAQEEYQLHLKSLIENSIVE